MNKGALLLPRIQAFLREHGPATKHEIAEGVGSAPTTISRKMSDFHLLFEIDRKEGRQTYWRAIDEEDVKADPKGDVTFNGNYVADQFRPTLDLIQEMREIRRKWESH